MTYATHELAVIYDGIYETSCDKCVFKSMNDKECPRVSNNQKLFACVSEDILLQYVLVHRLTGEMVDPQEVNREQNV